MGDSVTTYQVPDYIPTALTEDDKKRLNKQAWGEYGTAAGVGALGTAAQLGLSLADTAAETKNKESLANLQALEAKNQLGLGADVKQEYEHAVMNPVRSAVTAMEQRENAVQAASGRSDAGAVTRAQRVASETLADQAAKAGSQIEQANIAERARQRSEIESRTSSEAARERQRIEMIGQSIGGLMENFAKVSAANPSKGRLLDGEIVQLQAARGPDGKLLYPGLQVPLGDARKLIESGNVQGMMGNRAMNGTVAPNAPSEGG